MRIWLTNFSSSTKCGFIFEKNMCGMVPHTVFCHVRKREQERFLAALKELPSKMMLLGYTDYLDTCHAILGNRKSHKEKEVTGCDAVRTTEQA